MDVACTGEGVSIGVHLVLLPDVNMCEICADGKYWQNLSASLTYRISSLQSMYIGQFLCKVDIGTSHCLS
eukprot:15366453-Ditylum_brightwellii.AAC.3